MSQIDEAKAKQRFLLLNLVRLAGIAMVLVAVTLSQLASNIPAALNLVVGMSGLAVFYFLPRKLASQWKSEDE